MKKIIALLCALTLLFSFAACGGKHNEDANADESTSATDTADANSPESEPDEKKQTADIQENKELTPEQAAYLFNRAFSEAAVWFNFYNDNWNNEDYFINEKGYQFAINHESINSLSSLKEHLYKYFSKNLVDGVVSEMYMEQDGKLYQYSPEAGDRLPEYRLDRTTAVISSLSENSTVCDITVNMYFDDGPDSEYTREENETLSIDFVFENGNWVIDNYFKHDLYPPYTWDHISPLNGDSLG